MDIVKAAENLLLKEIEKTGAPEKEAFYIGLKKGIELAKKLGADKRIVRVGAFLMDLKVGQAWKEGRSEDHVKMSADAALKFLDKFDVSGEFKNKVMNCIEAHHGTVPYQCLEAEICANIDSFMFLNPKGFLAIFAHLMDEGLSLEKCIGILESKIEEKHKKVSLDILKKEAEEYYKLLKKLIDLTKKPH